MTASSPLRIAVTGANRGLGLEFARLWLREGHQVFALVRSPQKAGALAELEEEYSDHLFICPCDVGDDDSVAHAAEAVSRQTKGLDILVNNAGIYLDRGGSLENLNLDAIRKVMDINAYGPLRVSHAFLPLLRKGTHQRLVNITSLMGSIEDNGSGSSYAYRMSKTALNMATKNMAHELRSDGITCVALHPGWVQTDMGSKRAPLSIEDSVNGMLQVITNLSPDQSGCFYNYAGKELPW